jgi:hypothetical protein
VDESGFTRSPTLTRLTEEFALRLCDLSETHEPAERAFKAISEGRKIAEPSDRVKANFLMFVQDNRFISPEVLAWLKEDLFEKPW